MGSTVSTAMDENLKKNQAFMKETQQLQLGRQMQMQDQMRQRQMSMMLAGSREMFRWIASFYGVACVVMVTGFLKTKKPVAMVPFLPLSFMVGYQYDYTYGNKVDRIRAEAERIMREEQGLLSLPYGLPTFQDIEEARLAADAKKDH